MATLSVLRFSTAGGAAAALEVLLALHEAGRFRPGDLAMVSWKPRTRVPALRPVRTIRPRTPMGPGFWNLVSSHLFCLPAAAAAAGLPAGGTYCSLADLGIRDDFMRTIQARIKRGTSALFVLTDDANVDRVIQLLEDLDFTVASTNLSQLQFEGLRLGFGARMVVDRKSHDSPPRLPAHDSGQPPH